MNRQRQAVGRHLFGNRQIDVQTEGGQLVHRDRVVHPAADSSLLQRGSETRPVIRHRIVYWWNT